MISFRKRGGEILNSLIALRTRILTVSIVFCLSACESDSTKVRILAYNQLADSYEMKDVELQTIEDMGRLEGDATVIRPGLSIELNYLKDQLAWKDDGHVATFNAIEKDGVLIPEDYDSLAMASIYHNIEHAMLFFRDELGLKDDVLKRLPTYYQPKVVVVNQEGEEQMLDSAFYMKVDDNERGFFILPFDLFQWLPMSLNTGIIVHEYTHYVFDRLVLDDILEVDPVSYNFLSSVNEGVADFYAAVSVGDPDFMAHSIPKGLFETEQCNASRYMELTRDISNPDVMKYNQAMDAIPRNMRLDPMMYCPYEIGLFFASLLYEIAYRIDGDPNSVLPSRGAQLKVSRCLRDSLVDLGTRLKQTPTFELWDLFSIMVSKTTVPAEKELTCQVIEERYEYYFFEVQGC